jgi:hypothetical protein
MSTLRDKCILSALAIIPNNKLRIVVETVCESLLGYLEHYFPLSERRFLSKPSSLSTSDSNYRVIEDNETTVIAELACRGLLVITSWYLDEQRKLSLVNTDDVDNLDNKNRSASTNQSYEMMKTFSKSFLWFSSGAECSTVTVQLLHTIKRLRSLQLDFGIYTSIAGLRSTSVCREIADFLADNRANEIFTSNRQHSFTRSAGNAGDSSCKFGGNTSQQFHPLTPDLRKACSLLEVSTVYFACRILKNFIARDEIVRFLHYDDHYA